MKITKRLSDLNSKELAKLYDESEEYRSLDKAKKMILMVHILPMIFLGLAEQIVNLDVTLIVLGSTILLYIVRKLYDSKSIFYYSLFFNAVIFVLILYMTQTIRGGLKGVVIFVLYVVVTLQLKNLSLNAVLEQNVKHTGGPLTTRGRY